MAENVILLQRKHPSLDRQIKACLPYLDEHDYVLIGTAPSRLEALALVYNGAAKVVIATTPADDDWQVKRLLDDAGGRFEICRESRTRALEGPGHDTEEIVTRMYSRGGTTREIARLWDLAEDRVRAIIEHVRGRR